MKMIYIIFLLTISSYCGGLKWEDTTIEMETETVPDKKAGIFSYQNHSSKSISFTKIKASCGCVLVEIPEVVQSGERGEIKFKAPIPIAGGKYTKTIRVDTDESDGVEYTLKFTVINTDESVNKPRPLNFRRIKTTSQGTPKTRKPIERVPQLYQRPAKMTPRDLIIEKLMAKQALARKKSYKKQDECPFLPLGIVSHLYLDWNGLRIYTCCEQCLILLKESTHHAIIKLAEKGQTPVEVEKVEAER